MVLVAGFEAFNLQLYRKVVSTYHNYRRNDTMLPGTGILLYVLILVPGTWYHMRVSGTGILQLM